MCEKCAIVGAGIRHLQQMKIAATRVQDARVVQTQLVRSSAFNLGAFETNSTGGVIPYADA